MESAKLRNLVLPLKAEFFHAIREGRKPMEYRLRNAYWTRRIARREFDQVILTLGYPPACDSDRRLVYPWRGYVEVTICTPFFGRNPVDVFGIRVGPNS